MNRHTSELYRLAELPAFIEEALSNVSLKRIISACINMRDCRDEIWEAVTEYAEQWVDDWIARHPEPLAEAGPDHLDPEIRAIEAGVKLFSNPDCKAGLPEQESRQVVSPQDHRLAASLDAMIYGMGFLVDGAHVAPARVEMIPEANKPIGIASMETMPLPYGFSCGGVNVWARDAASISKVRHWMDQANAMQAVADELREEVKRIRSNGEMK